MLIDYIYLVLILVLISCIVFLIILSYEYRINEGFISLESLPIIDNYGSKLNTDVIQNAINLNNAYKKYSIDAYNKQINKEDAKNLDLLKKSVQNVKDSEIIYKMNNLNLQPSTNVFPVDKLISTIKSRYNSQYLSTFANDSANYGVIANDKCLTVNGLCKEDFCLLDCQNSLYTTDSQKFSSKRIYGVNDASRIMNTDSSKISSTNIYPFNIFTSLVNNNCLSIGDEGITVEKCNLNNIKQQWDISPDENICVLN